MNLQSEQDIQEERKYRDNFQAASNALLQCQQSKNLQSCLHCQALFECSIREQYIQATYESMSKGQEGAFDFN